MRKVKDIGSQDRGFQTSVTNLSSDCLLAPPVPALQASAIHIWEVPLEISDSAFLDLAQLLSDDERTRASRFHFEKDTRRFTIARASVRSILAGYTFMPAHDIRFVYSEYGKPSLADAAADVRFSVSHSGGLALLAVARGREVGVDLEAIREDIETDKLAERFFSDQERQSLRLLPAEQRVPAFFRCWTCKEAFLKAQGVGLSRSLGSFDVDLNPERGGRLVSTRPDPGEADLWSLHEIEPAPGYAAALAVEGSITALSIFRCR